MIELKILRDFKTGAALQGLGWPLIVSGLILLLVWWLRRPRRF
ncbi:hypothetical protein [Methylobacterium radiotolerans]|nr:hypothetical protein [Methylobacterium radiotolerans]